MRIELIPPHELGRAEQARWQALQAAEPTIDGPALSAGWARCVGAARADARVAVVRDGAGRVHGFVPIQAGEAGAVEPLAASLNLGCGLVGDPQLEWGASAWLRDVRARALVFEGAPERQVEFARAARGQVIRLTAEIFGGSAALVRAKREEGYDLLEQRGRRLARLAAHGAPRSKLFSCEGPDFSKTLYWSADAFRRPQEDWEIAALRAAFEREEEDGFHGALFTVHTGDALAAGAFFLVGARCAQLVFYGEAPELAHCEPAAVAVADAIGAFGARGLEEVELAAVEGPLAREFATRRRQRLYGLIRPAAKRRFSAPFAVRARRAERDWSRHGPIAV